MKQRWPISKLKAVLQRIRQVWRLNNPGTVQDEFFDWRAEFKGIEGIRTDYSHGERSIVWPYG